MFVYLHNLSRPYKCICAPTAIRASPCVGVCYIVCVCATVRVCSEFIIAGKNLKKT